MRAVAAAALAALAFASSASAGTTGVRTELVDTFDGPTYVSPAPGRPHLLFVTEKDGVVRVARDGVALERPFLDIRDLVADVDEQGLLSIAFAPDYRRTRRFYVYFTADSGCSPGCPIRVDEFKTRRDDPTRARRSSRRRVIEIPHPDDINHNGATAAFGPDGMLWLATGDGGGAGDEYQSGRDMNSLLGKLLRINPLRRDPALPGYRIPRSNPFLGVPGRNEIWSYGLRNPFRFSFGEEPDVVAIGDVGQGSWEEVDVVRLVTAKGAGFGWPEWEGNFDYPESPAFTPPATPLFPLFTYPNQAGPSAVTGGVFAHDPELPQLEGRYLVSDFYAGQIYSFGVNLVTNEATDVQPLDVAPIPQLVAFAAGLDGQLYVLSLAGELYRLEPEA